MSVLKRSFPCLVACLAAMQLYAQDSVFEEQGVPSFMAESRFSLIAIADELELYSHPDVRSAQKTIPYASGWRIPYDETLVRSLEVVELSTIGAGSLDALCEGVGTVRLDVVPGEPWTYLQKRGEGRVMASIQGKTCLISAFFRGEIFGDLVTEPPIQWWVQVLYEDGVSPGWLLVGEDNVSFGRH